MALDVKVKISKAERPISVEGFGVPLLLEGKVALPADKGANTALGTLFGYTEVENLDELMDLFGNDEKAKQTSLYQAAELLFMQDRAPSKIAVCRTSETAAKALIGKDKVGEKPLESATGLINKPWRQLVVPSMRVAGETSLGDLIRIINSTDDRLLFTSIRSLESSPVTGNESKQEKEVVAAENRRVMCLYYPQNAVCPEAAVVGASAGKKVGSITYKNIMLKGLEPCEISQQEYENLHKRGCFSFVTKSGDNVTTEGKTVGGEYLDVLDASDYLISSIQSETQRMLNRTDKIPYNSQGIAMLESVCSNQLLIGFANGIVAGDESGNPDFSVSYAAVSEVGPDEKDQRKYVRGQFRFTVLGAVHNVEINGVIEI